MIEVAAASGCPVHLTHATMNFAVNAGRAPELLALLDDAARRGIDVTLDSYPYLPAGTTLAALLPSWARGRRPDALWPAARRDRARRRIRRSHRKSTGSDGCHGVPVDWTTIEITGVRRPDRCAVASAGRRSAVADAAGGRDAFDFCFDLLLADELGTSCLMHVGDEDNVQAIMRHPAHLVGSDGSWSATGRTRAAGAPSLATSAATSATWGVLTLEECVAKMTGRPARPARA